MSEKIRPATIKPATLENLQTASPTEIDTALAEEAREAACAAGAKATA